MAENSRELTRFCSLYGQSATDKLLLVQRNYRNEALYHTNIFRLYSRLRDGRELVEEDDRGYRLKSTRTEVNIIAVADFVKSGLRIASRMIAESSNFPKTVVLRIPKKDLGKRKLFARFFYTP
jgi:hypothetical protein